MFPSIEKRFPQALHFTAIWLIGWTQLVFLGGVAFDLLASEHEKDDGDGLGSENLDEGTPFKVRKKNPPKKTTFMSCGGDVEKENVSDNIDDRIKE